MRYWGLFLLKLAVIWGLAQGLQRLMKWWIPVDEASLRFGHHPFTHDLAWTTAMMVYTLICVGLLYLAILDQRYRCRTCCRRLRMPVNSGSWDKALIFAPPKTEYICPYGHGTMSQRELQISGRENPEWVEHKDLWEELESYGRK